MSGFFSKLVGKKKPARDLTVEEELALAKESLGESWTEHEVTDEIVSDEIVPDEIVEDADTLEMEQPVFGPEPVAGFPAASGETPVLSEAEFDALGVDIEQTATRLARLNLADMPDTGSGAEPATSPLDPAAEIDNITQEIQADIVAAQRLQAQAAKQKPVPETRPAHGLPDPDKDLKE